MADRWPVMLSFPILCSLHCFLPAGKQRFPLFLIHGRKESLIQRPALPKFFFVAPEAGMQPGQLGGAQSGGFPDFWAMHRAIQNIRLELH